MIKIQPLSDAVLQEAFTKFAKSNGTEEKIRRWIWYPHSIEKWFQFEFLFHLDTCYRGQFHIGAEKKGQGRMPDLQIYDMNASDRSFFEVASTNDPLAVIELKAINNWYISWSVLPKLKSDIEKIENYPVHGMVIVFAVIATAGNSSKNCSWISDQIQKHYGVGTADELLLRFKNQCHEKMYVVAKEQYEPDEETDRLELQLIGYRNSRLFG